METIITFITDNVLSNLDFGYMLSVNLLSYAMIKWADELNGPKPLSKTIKRLLSLLSGIIIGAVIYFITEEYSMIKLLYSFVLSLFSWDYIFRPMIKKFNIGYKKE